MCLRVMLLCVAFDFGMSWLTEDVCAEFQQDEHAGGTPGVDAWWWSHW